jgi:UDP-N-acetylglucosamine acyltransferase
LERRGFTPEQMRELRAAYRVLLASKKNTAQALEALRAQCDSSTTGEHLAYLIQFIESAERGVIK